MNTQLSAQPQAAGATRAALFSASAIVAGYAQSRVLQGTSLRVDARETGGLLGRNGSGRSTFLKAVMKLLPSSGAIRMNGQTLDSAKTHQVSRAGIGYVPEDRAIFPDLTV